jgi:hypothetical protein
LNIAELSSLKRGLRLAATSRANMIELLGCKKGSARTEVFFFEINRVLATDSTATRVQKLIRPANRTGAQ